VFWLLAGVVLFYRLGGFPLKDFDEAIYVDVAREMLRTGDYLTLHFNHGIFFEKPPLYFWASGLVIRVLGFSEFTSRLPGVLFGALTLWVTTRWGRDLGGIVCGFVSGSLLLSTAMFLENGSRHATHDSLLLFLSTAALWTQWLSRRSSRPSYGIAVLLGLAVLAKSAAAFPVFVILGLLHWLLGDYRAWTREAYLRSALIFGLIVAPWYLVETIRHGMPFWQSHVGQMVWERATRSGFLYDRGHLYYTRFLIAQLSYLWPLGVMAVWMAAETQVWRGTHLLEALRRHRESALTFVLAILVPIVLFSAARNHVWWYILPSIPPLCLVGGLLFEEGRRRSRTGRWRGVLFWTLAGLVLVSAVREVQSTLTLQIRNGIVVYGPQSQLAKRVSHHAKALGISDALVLFPTFSPTVAAYVPFQVVFDPDYAGRLAAAPLGSAIFILDRRRAIAPLLKRAPSLTILEETGGWALALTRTDAPTPEVQPRREEMEARRRQIDGVPLTLDQFRDMRSCTSGTLTSIPRSPRSGTDKSSPTAR
jgi:4-amino-4-deoxy-L-arabinose transferase-like glycosyltransferase